MTRKRPAKTDRICSQLRKPAAHAARCSLQLRFHRGANVALGPCKAELLEAIRETGSLGRAARSVGTSYMRAWLMLKAVNESFREPLATLRRGGRNGGGTRLTAAGERVLALYRDTERACSRTGASATRILKAMLRK